MVEQHFCLRWNNYRTNITAEFETLREGEHFVDVTLACDGQQLKAHKVVLSACSPYFKELLQGNPCTHPIIILRDVAYTHMRSLLEFMYAGEVNISQVHLGAFLHTAEALKIRGLAESSDDRKEHGGLNSNSPLSALKSSIIGLGNMGLPGLGSPSILERPLVPQLLPHHTDKPGPPLAVPPHHLPPHLVPPPLSLAGGTPLPTPSQGGPPSTSSSSSTPSSVPQGPLPLTVPHSQAADRPPRPPEPSERTPSPPPPLPPCKRIRLEKRSHLDSPAPPLEKNSHADPTNGPGGAATRSAASTPTPSQPPEDLTHPVLKTEPVESVTPDTEGGAGWSTHEEGDSSSCGGGGGGCGEGGGGGGGGRSSGGERGGGGGGGGSEGGTTATPGPTPPGGTPPEHENTSHLLQALSSESHLQGEGVVCLGAGSVIASREVPQCCPYCSKLISNFYNLKKHIATMHQSPAFYHACAHCSAAFRTAEYLRKHLVNVHKYPVKKKK